MTLSAADWIAIAGVCATVLIGVVSWIVSASLTRRTIDSRILGYRMEASPLMTTSLKSGGLKIEYKGEELPNPLLLTVEIFNLGNVAIENPPVSIANVKDATYIIPVQVDDPPPGYAELWGLERVDGEECKIVLDHINPGQTLRATFLLDEMPKEMPRFICPQPNLVLRELKQSDFAKISTEVAKAALPMFPGGRLIQIFLSR